MPPLKRATAPVVTKTETRPRPSMDGPVLSRLEPVEDSVGPMKMLVYGESGSGKTVFASTFPGPVLWIVSSGSMRPGELQSVPHSERGKITKVVLRQTNEVKELCEHVRQTGKFQTVVLDHASGLADDALKEILGLDEIPAQKGWGMASQQQYGQQALQLKTLFRALLNLDANVVIVAQQRTFGGREDGGDPDLLRPTVGAALSPSVAGWLAPACDFVVQMFKKGRTEERVRTIGGKEMRSQERVPGVVYCLRTAPHDTFLTKFRLPKGIELPEYLEDPSYEKVMNLVTG